MLLALWLAGCSPSESPQAQAVAAEAPAPSCNLPRRVQPEPATRQPSAANPDGRIDYYVFALSWQPQWCLEHGEQADQAVACRMNRFGFRVHGLWPSSEHGQHPSYCQDAPALEARLVRSNLCMMPSAHLQQHEWAAHGTCGWKSGEAFLSAVTVLWNDFQEPDLADVRTAGDLRQALIRANPDWSADAIDVRVTSGNRLSEVRVCLDSSFKTRACPGLRIGAPDRIRLRVAQAGP